MADPVKGLSKEAHELLNFFEQFWFMYGALPTRDKCVELEVCTAAVYDNWIVREVFKDALRRRDLVPPDEAPNSGVLSEHQLIVANAMFDTHDTRSQVKKLKELRCSPRTYAAWLRDPSYQAYIRRRGENLLGDNGHEAHLALLDRVRSGDVAAIKYWNEITGYYVPNTKDSVDVNAILHRVLEIIMRHVPDEGAQAAIANDMLALSTVPTDVQRTQLSVSRVIERSPKVIDHSDFGQV